MVQKQRISLIVWYIFLRIFLFVGVVLISVYTSEYSLGLLDKLGYQTPNVIWGGNLVDASIELGFVMAFWSGIILGILGRKIDYILIILFLLFGFWDFYTTETVTTNMYIGLISAAILGNAIGFGLKLLRQKFLPGLKV